MPLSCLERLWEVRTRVSEKVSAEVNRWAKEAVRPSVDNLDSLVLIGEKVCWESV